MALVRRSCNKFYSLVPRLTVRFYSDKNVNEKDIKKSVFISQSKDIYTNLAMEDWLYKNFDFTHHHVLLLWQNDPCVTIGRHQNPWLEANCADLANITEKGVELVRRSSGGGAAYHDQGNLNMTFFTPSQRYNKLYNMEVIKRSLFREFGLRVDISPQEDLCIRDYKVSGTAAKLGSLNSYHHCSLLVKSNKVDLNLALQKPEVNIKTNAPHSTKTRVMNICEENPKVTIPSLIKAVGWEFMRTKALTVKDGGLQLASKQKGFQMINPTENWFPGLNKIRDELKSWNWCYGKTPKFTISKSFLIPESLLSNNERMSDDLRVTMVVDNGKISDVTLFIPPGLSAVGFAGEVKVLTNLRGQKFSLDALNSVETALGGFVNHKEKFVTECLKQVMSSV